MIIIFHYVGLLFYQALLNRKRLRQFDKTTEQKINYMDSDLENTIKFDPPVYRQRYAKVFQTLLDERWRTKIRKLCDFGCAEFGLFVFIKRLNRLNHILFVDIDENILKDHINRVQPLTIEYLKRREEPLQVSVFAGSVGDPDYHVLDVDVVTAVELIEHLYPDTLDAVPYNIFNYIEPKIVVLTTPNADFNILFSSNTKRFRHYDHKFEWTREQFEDWANNIVIRFPDYTVSFSGIGEGPEGTEHLGDCSQMALFIRNDVLNENYVLKKYSQSCICNSDSLCTGKFDSNIMNCSCTCPSCSPRLSWGICTYYSCSKQEILEKDHNIFYKLVEEINYPFEIDNRTEEEKILDELRYRINTMGQMYGRFFVEERDRSEIPLIDLLYGPDGEFMTETELTELLRRNGYQIEECLLQETDQLETCVIHEPFMDNITSSSETSDFDITSSAYYQANESVSDWDEYPEDTKLPTDQVNDNKDLTASNTVSESLNNTEEPDPCDLSNKNYITEENNSSIGIKNRIYEWDSGNSYTE